jgi:penicillin-binding protein-related factor A (putative recombinase)
MNRRHGASKAHGNAFEDLFYRLTRLQGIAITRIPDGCRFIGRNQIIPVKSPWDFILSYEQKSAYVDVKTTEENSFSNSMITQHQAEELAQHNRAGIAAGYVVWLRKLNRVFFMPAMELVKRLDQKGSFNHESPFALLLGDIGNFDVRKLFLFFS